MIKSVKTKWLKALRSGKYKQIQGGLCRVDSNGNHTGYCCLGVLTDLYIKDGNPGGWNELGRFVSPGRSPEGGSLTLPVMRWAGLKSSLGNLRIETENERMSRELADMNDSGNYSFKKIANVIEKYL